MKSANTSSTKTKTKPANDPSIRDPKLPSIEQCELSPGERREMIAKAAYYRAEKQGFAAGTEVENWLSAEAEVNRTLGATSRA